MSLVEKILNRIYILATDPTSDLYLATILLSVQPLVEELSRDRNGIDLEQPLLGACPDIDPGVNAILDLLAPSVTLEAIRGTSFSTDPQVDHTGFQFSIASAGGRVPAHPEDFDLDLGIVGPSSLKGISDYGGPKLEGSFRITQRCSSGETATARGKFIGTIEDVSFSIVGRFYVPAETDQPMHVKIDKFTIDGIEKRNMTLTLLREDGSLPPYNIMEIPPDDVVDSNFYMAQGQINFPLCPSKVDCSVFKQIIDTYDGKFEPNSDATKSILEDQINQIINNW